MSSILNSPAVENLRRQERNCLDKLQGYAQGLRQTHPEWSRAVCLGRAIADLPRIYCDYQRAREGLGLVRVLPLPMPSETEDDDE